MYEIDEETGAYIFTIIRFYAASADCRLWLEKEPTEILLLINTILFVTASNFSSGAVRNHDLPTMIKVFEIAAAGYTEEKN